jgi:hypothetical protein
MIQALAEQRATPHALKLGPFARPHGGTVEYLIFDADEQRVFYRLLARSEHERGEEPGVVLDQRIVLDYHQGLAADDLVLSLHVIFPGRLGVKAFLGVDISPGAKTYIELHYARSGDEYVLGRIEVGAQQAYVLGQAEGLIKPLDFPFSVLDRLPVERGCVHATLIHGFDRAGVASTDATAIPLSIRK